MPSYRLEYSVSSAGGKPVLNGRLTQSGVSGTFRLPIPLYIDYGKGPVYLGSVRMIGNTSIELPKDIPLAEEPKKVLIGALNDILAEKIDVVRR